MSTQGKANTNSSEKLLEAEVYVNRNGLVMNSAIRTPILGGDRGVLSGQHMLAALSVAPRIFGFCGGSHQQAAAFALESAWDLKLPANAKLIRAIAQATEIMQNIPRWFYTTCAPDLVNPKFQEYPLFEVVQQRFTKFQGTSFRAGFMASRFPIALYALIAGQWPHADFMVPGGVSTDMQLSDLTKAYAFLNDFRKEWLEPNWLGCSVERYLQIQTWTDLLAWMEENEAHRNSDLGVFIRASQEFGLDELGKNKEQYLSYGAYLDSKYVDVVNANNYNAAVQLSSGYFNGKAYQAFDYESILEQLRSSAVQSINYQGKGVEVGALARLIMIAEPDQGGTAIVDPLLRNILKEKGASVFVRNFARMHEASRLFYQTQLWLSELNLKQPFAYPVPLYKDAIGLGLTEAPRGALAHYLEIENKKIKNYRILAPTVINVLSGLEAGKSAPLSAALKGITIEDFSNPIEIGMIARSFDAFFTM